MLWNDKSRVFLKNQNISCYVHSNHSNCSRCYISIFDGLVSILFVSFQLHILFGICKNQATRLELVRAHASKILSFWHLKACDAKRLLEARLVKHAI